MRDKKYFILVSTTVIISLIMVDFAIGFIGDYAMRKIPDYSDQLAKDNFRLNRVTTDIIVLGSSRGAHHYVSTELQDSINNYTGGKYTIYNGSIDGKFINSNSCAAESIMDRCSPNLLIFEVTESELSGRKAIRDMEFAAVNKNNNKTVERYINNLGWKEQVKTSINMFRYNQQLLRIASSFFVKGDTTGYEPLYNKMKAGKLEEKEVTSHRIIDEYSLDNFKRVLKTSREKGIRLVIVSSPYYKPKDNNNYLAQLCEEFDTPYIELYNNSFFNDHPELFHDIDHLNDDGAHIFTNLLFEKLKPYLNHMVQSNQAVLSGHQ